MYENITEYLKNVIRCLILILTDSVIIEKTSVFKCYGPIDQVRFLARTRDISLSTASRPAVGCRKPLTCWVPKIMWPEREGDNLAPSGAKVEPHLHSSICASINGAKLSTDASTNHHLDMTCRI